MATAKTVWIATDGSQWDTTNEALVRDALDAAVRLIESTIPETPNESGIRVAVDASAMRAAKRAVVELCRATYPGENVFRHDPEAIHPRSYAGRFLDEVGGPLRRVWFRFLCYRDGWIYEQPFFAINPQEFRKRSGA
jgi:hypothetical protein